MRFVMCMGLLALLLAVVQIDGGFVSAALAVEGHAFPNQIGMQIPATTVMQDIVSFHHLLLIIIAVIVAFVTVLLVIVMVKFNAKSNPSPSKTTHHTLLEVAWTVVPVLVLVVIAIPSFRLLYKQVVIPEAELTIKTTGYQWYWGYEYPDNGGISFDSNIVADKDLKPGDLRLLTVDNPMVVPVGTTVRLIVTGADVIHAWTIPSFGVKIDAIPGRLNETWFKVDKPGIYYGQCSELCGRSHAFMPIEVRAVSKEEFAQWVAQKQAAADAGSATKVAAVQGANAH